MPFRSKSDMVPVTPGVNNLTSAHDALFVYGSLLSNYVPKGPNPIVPPSTLRAAKLIGPATLRGFQLCDLGRYPCIVPVSVRCSSLNKSKEEEGMDAYVSGELYELNVNNAECWKVLDAYEGISKQYAEPYEYRREVGLRKTTPYYSNIYILTYKQRRL